MNHTLLIVLLLLMFPSLLQAAEHLIHPDDSPQAILDRAAPGDRLVFLPGLHQHVRCSFNYMETGKTAIEPNFNLDGYEVIGNVIKSDGQAIHCWRHSAHGVIADNLRIHDNSGKPVFVVNAPAGWQAPDPPVLRNNRNHLVEVPVK